MENPAQGGAPNSRAGRSDASEFTRPTRDMQRTRRAISAALNLVPACGQPGHSTPGDISAGPRLERLVERVHALGPRPLGELLAEIATATGEPAVVVGLVQEYSALDPEIVRALGGDSFPVMPLQVVR